MAQGRNEFARQPVRVGVVGVGVMGSNHARVFSDVPGVQLVGVADPDREQCNRVSGLLGCIPKVRRASFCDTKSNPFLTTSRKSCSFMIR